MRVRYARTWNAADAMRRAAITVELLEDRRTFHLCIVAIAKSVRATRVLSIESSHWATMIVPTVGELAVVVDRWRLTDDALAFDLAVRIAAPGAAPLVGPRESVRLSLPYPEKLVVGAKAASPHAWR